MLNAGLDESQPGIKIVGRKSNMETFIAICKIGSQWEFAVWHRKPKQGLGINLEGWDGERNGREVQKGGDICIPMVDSC